MNEKHDYIETVVDYATFTMNFVQCLQIKHTGSHYNQLSETIQMRTNHVGFDAIIKYLSQVFVLPFSVPAVKGLKLQ